MHVIFGRNLWANYFFFLPLGIYIGPNMMLGPIFVGRGAEKAKEIFPMSLVFSTEK